MTKLRIGDNGGIVYIHEASEQKNSVLSGSDAAGGDHRYSDNGHSLCHPGAAAQEFTKQLGR